MRNTAALKWIGKNILDFGVGFVAIDGFEVLAQATLMFRDGLEVGASFGFAVGFLLIFLVASHWQNEYEKLPCVNLNRLFPGIHHLDGIISIEKKPIRFQNMTESVGFWPRRN